MYSRQTYALKNVMRWLILLLLLNVCVNSQKQDEESLPAKEPQSSPVQKETPPSQSVPPQKELQQTGLQQASQQQESAHVSQESRRPPEEQPEVQPSTQRQETQQQHNTEELAESQPRHQDREHQDKRQSRLQEELQHEQRQSDGEKDGVQMKQEADPTSESLPTSAPSREERQQSQDEGTKLQQREMMAQEDNDQPPSSSDPLRNRLLSQDNQEEHEELRVEDEDDESLQEQQQSATATATAQEVEDAKEGEYHDHSIDEDLGDEDDGALPSDLPSLRWGQTAEIIKCCPPGEALARPEDGGGDLECRPAPDDQSWQPLLLNGRSGRLVPPDSRSSLVHGNVSCEAGNHFWLDSSAGERFELLTTGHLYLRRADALLAPLSFCTDRLLVPPDHQKQQGDDEEEGDGARAAHVCTLSLQERRSLLDENTLMPACARRTCLRKCCPRGLKVRWSDQLCVPQTGARPWQPSFWQQEDPSGGPTATPPASEEPLTMSGNPPCRGADGKLGKVFALQPAYYDEDAFFLREDGRLWVPHQHVTVPLEDFCVDQVEYEHPQQPGVLIDYHAAIVCFGSGSEAGDSELRVSVGTHVYRALLLVSALFLLVTLLVYCAVPELRNLHGRCLLSHVAALLTAYVCNLAGQMPPVYSSMAACQTTAVLMYFSFLAACFWLNAMSFDIWLTFSRLRSAAPNRSQTGRFIKYSVYCWCCPLVLTAVVITMQFVPDRLVPPENFIRPRLGEMSCWFPGSWEMLVYFHAPILMLMAANLVFFLLTAKNLIQTEKDTRMAGRQKKGTERFKIYVNLFIVMGITWIAEALSIHMGPKEIWIVTDVFNALQGFFIFLLFTLRRNTRNTIRRHFAASRLGRCCCKVTRLVPGLSSRKTSSTATAGSSSSKLSAQGQQNGTQRLKPTAEAEEDDKADTPV